MHNEGEHHSESIQAFEEIVKNYSSEWLAWNSAGDAYAQACQYEKAIECYKQSMLIKPKPRYIDVAMAIAQIYEMTGNTSEAIDAWKLYISILNEDWNTIEGTYVDRAKEKISKLEKILWYDIQSSNSHTHK